MAGSCDKFRLLLDEVCKSIPGDSILLSGGLDSSILLYCKKPRKAITIVIDSLSGDYKYSSLIASKFKVSHSIFQPSVSLIYKSIDELIADYKTFDPIFIRNMVIQQIGFQKAIELGFKSVIIGDGADELFGGYNFLQTYYKEPKILESKLKQLIQNMNFVSGNLARKYNLKAYTPFLHENVIEFAKALQIKEKLADHNGTIFGKFFLRRCYEDKLGDAIVWRKKEALETGSGMSNFISALDKKISDQEYINGVKIAKNDMVTIRDKEHLYYYQTYRKYFQAPIHDLANHNSVFRNCSSCHSPFIWQGSFCKVCGAYPV